MLGYPKPIFLTALYARCLHFRDDGQNSYENDGSLYDIWTDFGFREWEKAVLDTFKAQS